MAAVPNIFGLQQSYRHVGPAEHEPALPHLRVAADALHMALLTLDGPSDVSRETKHGRVATARHLLVEGVTSLARARVYLPGVRTYAVNVVTNSEPEPDRELTRLHELVTTLLWRNYSFLPARIQAQPLAPEDEEQLAAMVRELANHAKLGRAMRYKWLVAGAVLGLLGPVMGVLLYLAAAASGAMGVFELARAPAPPALPAA